MLKGIGRADWVLAALMVAISVLIMLENIFAVVAEADLWHPLSTRTWVMLPVFLLVTVPVLWRRRNVPAVIAVTLAATALHTVAFGWVTRCGAVLPLAFALAYAVARYAGAVPRQIAGLAGLVLLVTLTFYRDASAGFDGLTIALPGIALFYGAGLLVQTLVSRTKAPAAERVAA